eukprot:TRINITY_DN5339_c0_g1_i1.p1 TRINITY_DN5339_c0_g1~~TRINITY_DN5339_c0_g1_i1.p1  ORF type:complete len:1028 (-),score=270.07 TRINITY_DN5339_c0_g1_i1:127-3174(-)
MDIEIKDIQMENATKKRKIEEIAANEGSVEEPPAKRQKFEENQTEFLTNDVIAYILSFLPFPSTFGIAAQLSRSWSKIVHSLEFLSHIKHLSFRLCRPYNLYNKEARLRVFNMVSKCQNLEWINVRNCNFSLDDLIKILTPIATKLRHLDISESTFDDPLALIRILKLCPNLENLQAAKVRIRMKSLQVEPEEIKEQHQPAIKTENNDNSSFVHEKLQVLSLHKTFIPLDAIQQVLAATPNVVEIDVWGTYMGPIAIIESLFSRRRFRSLDLTDVVVLENVAPWEKIFENSGDSLKQLSLRRGLIVPEKFKSLMDQCTDLTELDLWGNSTLTAETLSVITKFNGMKFLNLTECKVDDELIKKIASEMKVLEEISLRRCAITDETLALLAAGELHKTLAKIDLFYCNAVTDKGINTLVNKCTNLKTIIISDSAVTAESFKNIIRLLPNLEELTFRRCKNIDRKAVVEALDGVQNTKMRSLDVSFLPAINDDIVKTLPDHFPNLVDLRLDSCSISTGALVSCLTRLPNIKNLELQYNSKVHDGTLVEFIRSGIMKRLRALKLRGCNNISDGLFEQLKGHYNHLPKFDLVHCHLSLDLVTTLESIVREKVEFQKPLVKKATVNDVRQYVSAVKGYHLVSAFIKTVMPGGQVPWYSSCSQCNRRVLPTGAGDGKFFCEHCFIELDVPSTSYRLKMLIGDHTGQCNVTAFDSVGKSLFRRPAQELKAIYETNIREYDKILEQVTFIRHNFVVVSTLSDHRANAVEESEFVGEASCKIQTIKELQSLHDRLKAAGLLKPVVTPLKGKSPTRSPTRSPPRSLSSTPQKHLATPNGHAARPKSPAPAPSAAKRTLFPPPSPSKPKSPKRVEAFAFPKEEEQPVQQPVPTPAPLDPAFAEALEGIDMNDFMLTRSQELRLSEVGTGEVKQEQPEIKQEQPAEAMQVETTLHKSNGDLKSSKHEDVDALLDAIKKDLPVDDTLKSHLPLSEANTSDHVDMADVLKFVESNSQHVDEEPPKNVAQV